jgi:membrane protein implicated in regulation of membrane protease activity
MSSRGETPTTGEMLEEIFDLVNGLGVMLLPAIILAVPALILLLPLVLLLIPFAILAAPCLLIVGWRRLRRRSSPPAHSRTSSPADKAATYISTA